MMRGALSYPRRERRARAGSRPQLRMAEMRPRRRPRPNPSVDRARAAGGPDDRASYVCGCGLLFVDEVSTTVVCPHCGCEQAW